MRNWLDLGLDHTDIGRFAAWTWDYRSLKGPELKDVIIQEAKQRWPNRDAQWYTAFVRQALLATKLADYAAFGIERIDLMEEN